MSQQVSLAEHNAREPDVSRFLGVARRPRCLIDGDSGSVKYGYREVLGMNHVVVGLFSCYEFTIDCWKNIFPWAKHFLNTLGLGSAGMN